MARARRARWFAITTLLALPAAVLGPGAAFAGTGAGSPSLRGVQPVLSDTGNANPQHECQTLTGLDDVNPLQIAGEGAAFPNGSPYTDGTLTVTISNWDAQAKTFDWASDLPVLGVWVKGGSGGEGAWYDYAAFSDQPPAAGADHDGALHPKDNPNGVAGLSHVTFCYGDLTAPPGTPDITVQKSSDAQGPLHPGDTLTYTIVVANVGDAVAHHVVLTDDLPAGVHPTGPLPALDGADGFCAATGSSDSEGHEAYTWYCELDTLDAGASATITGEVLIHPDAPCGDLTNLAHAEARDEPAGNVDGGNDAEVTDQLACSCDVAIDASVDPVSGNPGDEVTFSYLVRNTGEQDLQVTVTDDVLGTIGSATVSPGEGHRFDEVAALTTRGSDVVHTATVHASTDGGPSCSAQSHVTVTVVAPEGGGNPPPPDGGTAFTGPIDLPIALIAVLITLGSVGLVVGRRRPTPRPTS